MQSTFETTSAVTSGPVGAATADTLHTATILSTAEGATEGVTQNEIEAPSIWAEPPATFGADQLTEARWLPLSAVVASPGADALATEIAALVAGHEVTSQSRQKGCRKAGMAKQRQAAGAILGGVLRRWARLEPLLFRSRDSC